MNTENFISLSNASPVDLVGTLPDNSLALEQRIHFAQQTIRNTMVKLGHLRRPQHLLWAMHNSATYRPIGFARATGYKNGEPTMRDITSEIRGGSSSLSEDDYLRFAILYPGSGTIGQGYIQLRYLRNDPISIAQMTRQACYAHEAWERRTDLAMQQHEQLKLEKAHATAVQQHAKDMARLTRQIEAAQGYLDRQRVRNARSDHKTV